MGFRIALSLTVFFVLTTLFSLLASTLSHGVQAVTFWTSALVATGLTIWFFKFTPSQSRPLKFWDFATLGLWTLLSARAFLWLIVETSTEFRILSPYNLGDMSLHIGLINYLASGIPLWPAGLILQGPLQYSIGPNFFNATLVAAGLPIDVGLRLVGFFMALLAGYLLWHWAGAFGIIAFLFGSGIAWLQIPQTGVIDFQEPLVWKNFFLTMVIPQRGFLFALPIGLLLLKQWQTRTTQKTNCFPIWLEIILYASLPLFSIHTFLFFSLLVALLFWFSLSQWLDWILVGTISLLPASLFVWLVTGHFSGESHISWQPGWIWKEAQDWWFFVENFGVILPILVACIFLSIKEKTPWRPLFWSALAITVLCSIVLFAKWDWDNMKLLVWCWLIFIPVFWELFLKKLSLLLRILMILFLCSTGVLSIASGMGKQHGYGLVSRKDYYEAQALLSHVPNGIRVLCAPDYNQPVLLVGRPVVVGFEGHLWSHGLRYQDIWQKAQRILQGEPGWQQDAKNLHVRHLYWGPKEEAKYPNSLKPWRDSILIEGENATIYKLW